MLRATRSHPATAFNLNYADPDGQALALCIGELLVRGGWSPLSPAGPAPGFQRRGVIVWAPADKARVAEALAAVDELPPRWQEITRRSGSRTGFVHPAR